MDFNQYFCLPQFVNTGNEYFIDAGAYVGDTVEKFIWVNNGGFKHIYAFEPGIIQFNALVKRKERLINEWALDPDSISLINAGLSEKNGEADIILGDGMHLLSTCLDTKSNPTANDQVIIYALDN